MHYSITLAHQHFRNGKFQEAKIIYSELAKKHQTKIYDHNIALCDQYIKESNTVENGKGVLLNSPEKQIDVKSQTPVQERINGISYVEKRVKSFECDPIEGRKYKVSIVMPTYNNAKYIKQSIESLLNQTYSNIEILVVDDHSDDNTMEVVRSLKDERIKYYRLNCNLGTYFARSYGMFYSTGDYITFQDSDDFSHSKRIELHLSNMLKDGRLISTSTYIRVDGEMNIVQMHGKNERYALISLMFHKTLLGKAGYYDITTRGGDAEYELRIRRFIHKNQAIHIPVPTYIARSLDGSLTSGEINLSAQNDAQALSDERALYIAGVQNLLPSFNLLNIKDAFNFPMLRSPYHTSGVLDTSNIPEKIIGCVCVIPERLEIFKSVFASIISQVDTLFIFLDKMSEIPPFLNHPKVKCQFTQEYGDIADGGKFMPLIDNRFSGDVNDDDIYFTFDDDIVYPLDYVHSMYKSLKKYSFTAVCGLHGSIMNENFTSHRKDRVVLHFLKSLEKDTFVDILGTGTTCFKVSLIKNKITQNDITPRMIDIGFSKIGKNHRIPFVSVERNAQWLVDVSQDTPTLFDEMKIDDAPHTAILKESHVVRYGKAAIDANFINNSFSFEDTLTQSYENIKLNTSFLRVFFKNDKKIIRLNLQVGKKGKGAVEVQNAVTSKTIFQKNTDENGNVVFLINTSVNSCVNVVFERDIDSVPHMTATVVQDVSAPRELYKDDKAITACLATYPPRETCLQDVVECAAMKVDNFCLYLNKYEQVPSCIDVQNNRIHFILDQDGRPKASGKFRWIDTEGYIFILDDDIIYPQDYFSYLIAHIETFERKAFVGVHGVIFEDMISSEDEHIKSCMKSKFNFSQALAETKQVNMIGTGTLAFHSSLVECHIEELYNLLNFDKRTANANDEALAVFAKKYNMPMYIVSRQEGWLKNNKKMKYGIHEEHFNDTVFTKSVVDLLSEGNPWTIDAETKDYPGFREVSRFTYPLNYVKNLKEFDERLTYASSSWSIADGNTSIDIELHLKKARPKILVVMLGGAKIEQDWGKPGPFFLGRNFSKSIEANILFISDPTFAAYPSVRLGWYLGTKENPSQQKLTELINIVKNKLDAEYIVFFGGSGGGFASLYQSFMFEDSLALIWNSQTNIVEYNPRYITDETASIAFGCTPEELEKYVVSNVASLYQNPKNNNKILYWQNITDHHVAGQLNPFLKAVGLPVKTDEYAGWLSEWFYLYLNDNAKRHEAPPKDMLLKLLYQVTNAPHHLTNEEYHQIFEDLSKA